MRSTEGGNSRMIACAASRVTRRLLGAKMKPRASAPASTEARASAREVVPQNLIQVCMRVKCESGPRLLDSATPARGRRRGLGIPTGFLQQLLQLFARIFRAHERFADQKCLI